MDPALLLEGSAKALLYASLLIALGASAVRWLLLPRAASDLPLHTPPLLEDAVARVAANAALMAFVACVLRLGTHAVSAFGLTDRLSWGNIKLIALQSRWGES